MAVISRLPSVAAKTTVTVTLTLEGAKEDTITITNASGKQLGVCVFTSGSTVGTVDVQINPDGENLTFESDIAKDTTTGANDYSITVPITTSTTNVKVMPEGALYWYGNECVDVTGGYSINPFVYSTGSWTKYNPTPFNNYVEFKAPSTAGYSYGIYCTNNKINITNYSKAKLASSSNSNGARLIRGSKILSNSEIVFTIGVTEEEGVFSAELTDKSDCYIWAVCYNAGDANSQLLMKALWLE